MVKAFVSWSLALLSTCVAAQQSGALPDSVVRDIAKDLANMQRSVDEARRNQEAAMTAQAIKWPGVSAITITSLSAPIRAGASETARSIAQAKQGMKYQVIDRVDEWYAVIDP
jgi:hypothetical protein